MVCVRDLPGAQKVVKSPFLEVEIRGKFYIQQFGGESYIVFDPKKRAVFTLKDGKFTKCQNLRGCLDRISVFLVDLGWSLVERHKPSHF